MAEIRDLPLEKIKVGEHDQRLQIDDESIAGLVVSIGRVGVLVPLIIRRQGDGILLVSGHRRLAAAKKANLATVPCIERSGNDVQDGEVVFAENFFRKDLSPVEQAGAIADEFKSGRMSIEQLAEGFHKSEHWVHSQIAICDWPPDVLEVIHLEAISISAAANLACVTDDNYRDFLIRNAVEQGATARTTAAWLQAFRSMQPQEQAIVAEPVPGAPVPAPAIPQVPCFLCAEVHLINEVSHVPLCSPCIQQVRQAGLSGG